MGQRRLPASPRARLRPPPRDPRPRPGMDPRPVALLARTLALRPRPTWRAAAGSRCPRLTQGASRRHALDRLLTPGVLVRVQPLERAPERLVDRQPRAPAQAAGAREL